MGSPMNLPSVLPNTSSRGSPRRASRARPTPEQPRRRTSAAPARNARRASPKYAVGRRSRSPAWKASGASVITERPGERSIPLSSREAAERDEANKGDDQADPEAPDENQDDPDDDDDSAKRDAPVSAISHACLSFSVGYPRELPKHPYTKTWGRSSRPALTRRLRHWRSRRS